MGFRCTLAPHSASTAEAEVVQAEGLEEDSEVADSAAYWVEDEED